MAGSSAFFFQAEDGIRDGTVTGVQTCALPISRGGVGVFAVQLAVRTGACVIALASERHHAWLRERGAVPIAYGDGVRKCITAAAEDTPVAAFIDLVGGGYVELALELGIAGDRIDTIVDFPSIAKYGVKSEGGAEAASAA